MLTFAFYSPIILLSRGPPGEVKKKRSDIKLFYSKMRLGLRKIRPTADARPANTTLVARLCEVPLTWPKNLSYTMAQWTLLRCSIAAEWPTLTKRTK